MYSRMIAAAALVAMLGVAPAQEDRPARRAQGDQQMQQGAQATEQDREFVQNAYSLGLYELESAELALRRNDPQLSGIAQTLRDDHRSANDELQRLAKEAGMEVPAQMKEEHRAKIDELSGLQDPEEFRTTWIEQQRTAHDEAIELYQGVAEREDANQQLKQYAQQTLPKLQEHQKHLEELE